MKIKTCTFFGHRNTSLSVDLQDKLYDLIEDLIINQNVYNFVFGSKSNFDTFCHNIVSKLKDKYSFINRISYPCYHERVFLEEEKEKFQKYFTHIVNPNMKILTVDKIVNFKVLEKTGKTSYLQRNKLMIDDSDICIFYYAEGSEDVAKNSGTKMAYDYAKKQKKFIINLYK